MRRTDAGGARRPRRRLRLVAGALTALLAAAPAAAAEPEPAPETAAVERGFEAYRRALEARDGRAALAAVSRGSIDYYDRMRRLALHADREALAERDGTERMLVLSLRHSAPRELLLEGSGGDLVAYAVDSGLVSDTAVARTRLGEITPKDGRARAWMVIDGEPTRGVMQFVLEDGAWKFDLEYAMKSSAGLVAALAAQSGMEEDAVILQLLSQSSGEIVGPEIWEPLVER